MALGSYQEYARSVSRYIRSRYPQRKLRKDINLLLGYFLALQELERLQLLKRKQVCILMFDTLFYDCAQINLEVFDLILYAGHLNESDKDLEGAERVEYMFLGMWINEVAAYYNPIVPEL